MGWLQQLFSRRRRYDELSETIREHLDEKIADLMDRGMTREQAERTARREFGNVTRIEERSREVWQWPTLESIWADVKFAQRQLRRSSAFSVTAVLTLALGIGVSTAIFSLIESFLLHPLPYPDANRLVVVWEQLRVLGIQKFPAPLGDFVDYRNENRVFDEMAAVEDTHFVLSGNEYPERIYAVRTTANLFPMMGLRTALGRVLTSEDNTPGHEHVVVLSNGLWRERFGGDTAVVGRNVVLDGTNYEVVGVLAKNERFSIGYPQTPQLWTPLPLVADPERHIGQLQMVGRLRSGVTLATAQAQLSELATRLEKEYHIEMGPHGEDPGYGVQVIPLQEELTGNLREPLLLMLGGTVLIFLIACTNIASLMLTHGLCREREFAIRVSLGAARVRLIRLLLVESIMLALAGVIAGLAIASIVAALLVRFSPYMVAVLLGNSMDVTVLGYAVGLGLVAVMFFGLAPALMLFRQGHRILSSGLGQQIVSTRRGQTIRRVLVVAESAMAVTLTIGAGMLLHSFLHLREVTLGFNPQSLLTAEVNLPKSYSTGASQREFYEELLEHLQSQPGVKSTAVTTILPAADSPLHDPFSVQGRPWQPFGSSHVPQFMNHQAVSTEYFRTMGITLRGGRLFTVDDRDGTQPVAIVNETMVRGFWSGENPIGKHLMLGAPRPGSPWLTVVGVVADVRSGGAMADTLPELYTPMAQTPAPSIALVIQTSRSNYVGALGELRTRSHFKTLYKGLILL